MRLNKTFHFILLNVLGLCSFGAIWLWPKENGGMRLGIILLPFLYLGIVAILDPLLVLEKHIGIFIRLPFYTKKLNSDSEPPTKTGVILTRVLGFLLLLFFVTSVF